MLKEEKELRRRCLEEDFFLNPKIRSKLITALVHAVREDERSRNQCECELCSTGRAATRGNK